MKNDYIQVYSTKGYKKEVEIIKLLSERSLSALAESLNRCSIFFD